jgi:hypothetical protein
MPAMDPTQPIEGQRRTWFKDTVQISQDEIGPSVSSANFSPSEAGHSYKLVIESRFEADYSNPLTMVIVIGADGWVASTTITPAPNGGPLPPPTAGMISQQP